MRKGRYDGLIALFLFIILLMVCIYVAHKLPEVAVFDACTNNSVVTVMKCGKILI